MKFPHRPLVLVLIAIAGGSLAVTAQAKTTTDYPEIVSIFSQVSFEGKTENSGRCTGTFIHPRLVLTASHCVRHFNASKMNGRVYRATDLQDRPVDDLTATPAQVYTPMDAWWGTRENHPVRVTVSDQAMPVEHGNLTLDYVEQDLAIIEFAQDFPVTVRKVAQHVPSFGDPVRMIGFGHHGPTASVQAGFGAVFPIKHFGNNRVSMIELDMLAANGAAQTCDDPGKYTDNWAICGGDSGGPLLDARTGEILGVASASLVFKHDDRLGNAGTKLSIYTDVTHGAGATFIRNALAEIATRKPELAAPASGRRGD